MAEIPFTLADVEANFDNRDLRRGRSYWRSGAVRDLAIGKGGLYLTSKVRGTRPKPYDVTVHIDRLPPTKARTSRLIFATECSCPVGLDCKHAAAACLEALSRQNKPPHLIGAPSGRLTSGVNNTI